MTSELTELCSHILSLLILCFIVHTLDMLFPTGSSVTHWLVIQLVTVILAIFANLTVRFLINTLLPPSWAVYTPAIVLLLFAVGFLVGLFNPLLCIIFTIANPIFGLLYSFFLSHTIGKQLTKSVLSTCLLLALFIVMEVRGYTAIDISQSAVFMNIPIGVILLGLWCYFDYKL